MSNLKLIGPMVLSLSLETDRNINLIGSLVASNPLKNPYYREKAIYVQLMFASD